MLIFRVKSLIGIEEQDHDIIPLIPAAKHADVNIFTVASGLLYEVRLNLRLAAHCQRFASIMILSVMKHTQSTVKFWFIVSTVP